MSKKPTGIRVRHRRECKSNEGSACNCRPSYEAFVWSVRDGRKIRKGFRTLGAAKSWRADATVALGRGELRSPTRVTLREAADAWHESAIEGTIRTRSGDPYKPSVLRSYKAALRLYVLDDLGGARLSELRRVDLQDLVDRLLARGLDPSTVRNALMPLRAIFRRAVARGELAVNPTSGLELPAVRGRRERIASPEEAAKLIAALPRQSDRPVWATAFYAGLRLGELLALRWEDVDLEAGLIRVERSWDAKEGPVEPKSRAGRRAVPIVRALRSYLLEHRLRSGRSEGLVFGRTAGQPFAYSSLVERAERAWTKAELERTTLHAARHTFASVLIAAGVNAKALSTYVGHASVAITLDRYGHLFPSDTETTVGLVDAYLAQAEAESSGASRV